MALTNLEKCTWRRNPRIHNNAMCFAEREIKSRDVIVKGSTSMKK